MTDEHFHALTAFIVVVDESGKAFAVLEPPDGVAVNYMPDMGSVRRACSEIVDDINNQITAQYVVNKQEEARAAFAEANKPSARVADALHERLGKHAADAHVGEWIG